MAVIDRHLKLSRLEQYGPVSVKVAATGGIFSTQTSSSIMNATLAVGTQLDFPRYLRYELRVSSTVTGAISSGTVRIAGSDVYGNALVETVAATAIAAQGTNGLRGSVAFATLASNGISLSSINIGTASSSWSNSFSFFLGHGNIIGLPNSIKHTNAVPNVFIGTTPQPGSFTVLPGNVPQAAISISNALATNTPLMVQYFHSR